ncbi:MAG TPA: hypothetical protein VK137_18660 [Planctomycetaceae bacterium]|nr:hypothetical protein [Planctomycetaceae bacterium]
MKPNPIIDEVRAIREQQAAEYGFDVRRIMEASRERLKKSNAKVVSFARERDPIVEEACAVRERLAAECDFDLKKIVERSRECQAASGRTVVNFSDKVGDSAESNAAVATTVKGER